MRISKSLSVLFLAASVLPILSGCGRHALDVPEPYTADATTPVQTLRVVDGGSRYYGSLSDAELRSLLTLREFQLSYRVDGERALRMNAKGLSERAGLPPVRFDGTTYPGALSAALSRTRKDSGFVIPLLRHDDTEVVMTGLLLVDGRTGTTDRHLAALRQALRDLASHEDVHVRCMALQVLSKDSDFNLGDMVRALSDESYLVRHQAMRMAHIGHNAIEDAIEAGDRAKADAIARVFIPAMLDQLQSGSPEHRRVAGIYVRLAAYQYAPEVKPIRPEAEGVRSEDCWTHSDWPARQAAIEKLRVFWADRLGESFAAGR